MAMRTYVKAHVADRPARLFLHFLHVLLTFEGIVSGFPGLNFNKSPSCEGRYRTNFNAFLAFAALLIHGLSRGIQRCIGENSGKANPGACFKSDQKAALPYPSQACQVGGGGGQQSCEKMRHRSSHRSLSGWRVWDRLCIPHVPAPCLGEG